MIKIFTTQLIGRFQAIREDNEIVFEEAGRSLAQAAIGEGKIFVAGVGEMNGICEAILQGNDRLEGMARLNLEQAGELTSLDRVVIFAPFSNDDRALSIADELVETDAEVIAISSAVNEGKTLVQAADYHIDFKVSSPIVPMESGEKIAAPLSLAALYAYYGLYLVVKEILEEHEDE
jgi:hypothetical protein